MIFWIFWIGDDEVVTRFLFKGQLTKNESGKPEAKWQAFEPENRNWWKRLETSVHRTRSQTEFVIWHQGKKVSALRSKPLVGRADISVLVIRSIQINLEQKCSLKVRPAPPPIRHSIIIKWPRYRDEYMVIAMALAKEATVKVLPP